MQAATREISHTIKTGFGSLQKTISIEFNSLNANIASSMRAIGNRIDDLIEQNSAVKQQLGKISSIASAQEALQRKMNTSSDQMASDIQYMRELSHRSYYGV